MNEPNALAGVAFTYVGKLMNKATSAARKDCTEQWAPSERRAVRHPVTGAVLGFATRTDPIPVAKMADEAELLPWFSDNRPHDLRDTDEIAPGVTDDQVIAALKQSHPHLVTQRVRITEQGLSAVLKQAESDPEFRPPGVEVTESPGTTNFYPKNPKGIESLFSDGLIAFDGTVRKELTEGDAQ